VIRGENLVTELWREPPTSARANLRTYATGLRRALSVAGATHRLVTNRRGYRIEVDGDEVDSLRFERLVRDGRHHLGHGDGAAAERDLAAALALWRGPALEDVDHGPVLSSAATALNEARNMAFEDLVEARLLKGGGLEVVSDLRRFLAAEPFRERAWGQLMRALHQTGDAAGALAAYAGAREALAKGLGIEPGVALSRLQRAVLTRGGVDLDEVITTTVPGRPAKTPSAPMPRQLPPDAALLVGRRADAAAVRAAVLSGGRPAVVAVHGPGGIGKSALAVRVAHELADRFPDGTLYVDLQGACPSMAPLQPQAALDRLVRALGVPPSQTPRHLPDESSLYRSLLAAHRMLVVLDNAVDAAQVQPLLPADENCAVLITSRRVLATIDGRHHAVGPLPHEDGLRLLEHLVGAARTRAEPAQAKQIVDYCDGLPLAIRIAGARLTAQPGLSLRALVDRLGDTGRRLDVLHFDEMAVRSAYSGTYRDLQEGTRAEDRLAGRAFRLLGLLRAPLVTAQIVAALLDVEHPVAEVVLDRLAEVRLIEVADLRPGQPHYRLQRLPGLYAAEQARREESADEVSSALQRVGEDPTAPPPVMPC